MTGVNGRVQASNGIFGTAFALTNNGYATFGSTSSSVPIAFSIDGDSSTPEMAIDTSGKVGIGTASPDTLLHIYNPDTNWGAYSVITLGTDIEGTNQAQLKYYRGASTSTESYRLLLAPSSSTAQTMHLTILLEASPGGNWNSPLAASVDSDKESSVAPSTV